MSWWQRQRDPTPEERDRILRERKAQRAIKKVDTLAIELQAVVDELHAIARRASGAEE